MRIAITGASGFIGSSLVKTLTKLKEVKVFLFDKRKHSFSDAESLKDFVENKDVIIHLAGLKSNDDIANIYKVNVLGTTNLLEAVTRFGKKNCHFIFPSSFLVYKENPRKILLNEDKSEIDPKDHYGLSKYLAEKIIYYYNYNKKIKSSILRIANVYGPVLDGFSCSVPNIFIENLINNKPLPVKGDGRLLRDLVYIDDVTTSFINAIIYQKLDFLIVNICTSKATKISDLISIIEKKLNRKAIINYDHDYTESAYWIGDNAKASKTINFKAKFNIETGIAKTIEWYQKK